MALYVRSDLCAAEETAMATPCSRFLAVPEKRKCQGPPRLPVTILSPVPCQRSSEMPQTVMLYEASVSSKSSALPVLPGASESVRVLSVATLKGA